MAYFFLVAWPPNCEECYFNNITIRAECAKCTAGLGVMEDDKTCARKCEIKGCKGRRMSCLTQVASKILCTCLFAVLVVLMFENKGALNGTVFSTPHLGNVANEISVDAIIIFTIATRRCL